IRTEAFAQTAKELGYTTSAVSQHIAALEANLRLQLFDRDSRGAIPTRAALAIAPQAETVLAALSSVGKLAEALTEGSSGSLHIGSFPTASQALVPQAIARYLEAYPRVEVTLIEDIPANLRALVIEGNLDLAV